jgi:hypothetical protein
MLGSRSVKVDGIKIDQNMLRFPHSTLGCATKLVGGVAAAFPATDWTGTRERTLGLLLTVVDD